MKCPECGCQEAYIGKSETICRRCGLVIDDNMVEDKPYSEQHSKVGSLGQAGTFNTDGRIFKESWMLSSRDKNIIRVEKYLQKISIVYNLTNHIEKDTLEMFKQLISLKSLRGRSIELLLIACIYISSIRNGFPKTMKELRTEVNFSIKKFYSHIRFIEETLNIKVENINTFDILDKYINRLNLGFKERTCAIDIYEKIKTHPKIVGKYPSTIVAGILYYVSIKFKLGLSQTDISLLLKNRERTLRAIYQEILKLLVQD